MNVLRLVAVLAVSAAGSALAQAASSQPSEKLLILPFQVAAGVDSLSGVQVADAARERVSSLARYKVLVVPKNKICEALQASGFPCDGLMDEQQARQLARFLSVDAFTVGRLERSAGRLTAHVRVVDVGGSGFAYAFSVDNHNPATPGALGEAIAARLNAVIRAGEQARQCHEQLRRGQIGRALDAARRATQMDTNLPAAHLCVALVHEAQRMPPDSLIAAAERALKGDPYNATAWETIARQYQVKGDTAKMIDAFIRQLQTEPRNAPRRMGIAQLLVVRREYRRAAELLDEGIKLNPGDEAMIERRAQVCIEGELWRCALDGLLAQVQQDSALWADTAFLYKSIGAAQALPDTNALLRIGREATKHHPDNAAFWKARGSAYDMAGRPDSAVWSYRRSLAIDPTDLSGSLLVGKTIIEGTEYDTAGAARCRADTVCVSRIRMQFANRLDTARVYVERAAGSTDTTMWVNAAAIMRTAGEKLVRAGSFERAYGWLDRTLQLVAPRVSSDTAGLRHLIRVNASFWFGLSSVPQLPAAYQTMTKSKSCEEARGFNERLARTKAALTLGRSVHAQTADTYLGNVARFEQVMPQVKRAFRCTNF